MLTGLKKVKIKGNEKTETVWKIYLKLLNATQKKYQERNREKEEVGEKIEFQSIKMQK